MFGWLSFRVRKRSIAVNTALVLLGIAAWGLVYLSGIHATIAGVALGLVMASRSGGRSRHAIEPYTNGVILPVFAFVAALVVIPSVGPTELSPAFWGIIVALPVGKLIGITAGAWLASRLGRSGTGGIGGSGHPLPLGDIVAVAGLGGIGFTVSLLMNELAWGANSVVADEGTLAVITASVIAAVVGATLTLLRSRHYRLRSGGVPRS
jgi:NhaA family Na+:H+ antiporter